MSTVFEVRSLQTETPEVVLHSLEMSIILGDPSERKWVGEKEKESYSEEISFRP